MGANLRELRQRRKSVSATKKITKAMELIAASKVVRAQQAAVSALPFTKELIRAVSTLATHSHMDHPLTRHSEERRRAALVVFSSDRGMNGAFNSNIFKAATETWKRLTDEGLEVKRYIVGRKGIQYAAFRKFDVAHSWGGFSDAPQFKHAVDIADTLMADFLTPVEEGGVDEIYMVYTRMESMLTQTARVRRLLPIEVVEGVRILGEHDPKPVYEFEPNADTVLNELMPVYIRSRVWFYLRQSAASQLASQQRAMKAATDNAEQLIQDLTREENQARQAEITQEITEIVGGASALSEGTSN